MFRIKSGFRKEITVRKELLKTAILFGLMISITSLLGPLVGIANAMAISNSAMLVPLSMPINFMVDPKGNFARLSIVYLSLGVLAWIASMHIVARVIIFFLVILFMVYTYDRPERRPIYFQITVSFIFMSYYPVSGWNLVFRLIILESSIVALMLAQYIACRIGKRKCIDSTPNFLSKVYKHFDKTMFQFALRTAVIAAIGVAILGAFNAPYEYWFPINLCVLAQPFIEVGREKSLARILNTSIAIGIVFVAMSITSSAWVHIIIMVALVIVGDFIFEFNFFTIYTVFLSVILGHITTGASMQELSIIRIFYVVGTATVVTLMDIFIFPHHVRKFDKKKKEAGSGPVNGASHIDGNIGNIPPTDDFGGFGGFFH